MNTPVEYPEALRSPQRACAPGTVDPDLFFPDAHGEASYAPAKRVCARCPFTAECLQFALVTGQSFGVWGWTTPKERAVIERIGLDAWLRQQGAAA